MGSTELGLAEAAEAAWIAFGESPVAIDVRAISQANDSQVLPVGLLKLDGHRCIEAYFDEHGDLASARTFLLSLVNPGWQVTAVVPLHRLGRAHEAFRAFDVCLQAWWRDAEGIVRFSGSERA